MYARDDAAYHDLQLCEFFDNSLRALTRTKARVLEMGLEYLFVDVECEALAAWDKGEGMSVETLKRWATDGRRDARAATTRDGRCQGRKRGLQCHFNV